MKIKFGSIIVKGSGKIGGHVVRNFRGQPLLTRLALPTKSARFLSNPQKFRMQSAFKVWNSLSSAERNRWNVIATTIPFTNQFGDTYYYSGRGLVTYLSVNCQLAGYDFPDALTFDSTISTQTASAVRIDYVNERIEIDNFEQFGNGTTIITMNQSINESRNYLEKDLRVIGAIDLVGLPATTLWYFVLEKYGVLDTKYTYTFGFKVISEYGMASRCSVYKATEALA